MARRLIALRHIAFRTLRESSRRSAKLIPILGEDNSGGDSASGADLIHMANKEIRHAVTAPRNFDASQLRKIGRRTKDGPQARRLLALASIYDGATGTEAAKIGGVTVQIVRDWVVKFNAHGPEGLIGVWLWTIGFRWAATGHLVIRYGLIGGNPYHPAIIAAKCIARAAKVEGF